MNHEDAAAGRRLSQLLGDVLQLLIVDADRTTGAPIAVQDYQPQMVDNAALEVGLLQLAPCLSQDNTAKERPVVVVAQPQ